MGRKILTSRFVMGLNQNQSIRRRGCFWKRERRAERTTPNPQPNYPRCMSGIQHHNITTRLVRNVTPVPAHQIPGAPPHRAVTRTFSATVSRRLLRFTKSPWRKLSIMSKLPMCRNAAMHANSIDSARTMSIAIHANQKIAGFLRRMRTWRRQSG